MKLHLHYLLLVTLLAAGCRKADVRTPPPPPEKDPESENFFCGSGPDSEYKGGSAEWLKFLSETLRYPDTAVNEEITGIVHIRFVIEKDGKVSNVEAIDGPGMLQGEAIRVINLSSGNWQPATTNGRAVKSYKIQPIVFQLKED